MTGLGALAGPVSGLVFDSWAETVPQRGATTGLAVHLDSPGSRPPQVLLLATSGGTAWDSPALVALLRQTLHMAQFRAIGPQTLDGWGHTLPAVFLPAGTEVAVVEQSAKEGS